MKLTILGSGTAVPNGSRNSAGYFVQAPDTRVMLDCGAGAVPALARYGMPWEAMTHLFVSHFHLDHIGELASLLFAFKWGRETERRESLTVLGPEGLEELIRGLDRVLGSRVLEPGFPVEIVRLRPGEEISLSPEVNLRVAKTPHTRESLAVRIAQQDRSICYTGDTGYSDELADFFAGADLLVSECSFEERREGVAHLSIDDVAILAERARVRRLVVTHFYFDVDESALIERLKRRYSGEALVGADGMSLEV